MIKRFNWCINIHNANSAENSLGNKGAFMLAEALKANSSLTKLDVRCIITIDIILIELFFSFNVWSCETANSLGPFAAFAFGQTLKQNNTLNELIITGEVKWKETETSGWMKTI